MNKYTLRFDNQVLEQKYLDYQNKAQLDHMKNILMINYPMLVLIAIICGLMHDYIPLGLTILTFLNTVWFHRYARKVDQQRIILAYQILVLTNPFGIVIVIYFSNHPQELGMSMIVCLVVQIQILITTPNLLLAAIQLSNNLITAFWIIYLVFGWSLYLLALLPQAIFCLLNYYNQKKNERQLFQQSQVNQSICKNCFQIDTLIKETTPDEIMQFKLNTELLKYELEFSNIGNFDLNTFLSSVIIDRRQNMKEYLYSKINVNNLVSEKHKIIASKDKQKLELEIYIQYYPELKFHIRILKPQDHSYHANEEYQIMCRFYRKLSLKIQVKSELLTLPYIFKQLCSLNARIQLSRILQKPYQFTQQVQDINIITILRQQFKNLKIKFEPHCDYRLYYLVSVNKIIFETLIYYVLRLINNSNHRINVSIKKQNTITILFCFSNKINLQNNINFLNNLDLLQNLISDRNIILESYQITVFVDLQKSIAFK